MPSLSAPRPPPLPTPRASPLLSAARPAVPVPAAAARSAVPVPAAAARSAVPVLATAARPAVPVLAAAARPAVLVVLRQPPAKSHVMDSSRLEAVCSIASVMASALVLPAIGVCATATLSL